MVRRGIAAIGIVAAGVLGVGTTVSMALASPAVADGCSGGGFWGIGGQRCVWTQWDGTVIWCDSGGAFGIWVSNNCYPAPPPPPP